MGKKINTSIIHSGSDPKIHFGSINDPVYKNSTLVFDIEIIFFYPWALSHRSLGLFGLIAVGIFALAVFESFIYLIGKGALEWGPNKQIKPKDQVVSLARDTSNTISRVGVRKVGQEGRNLNDQSFGNQEVSN